MQLLPGTRLSCTECRLAEQHERVVQQLREAGPQPALAPTAAQQTLSPAAGIQDTAELQVRLSALRLRHCKAAAPLHLPELYPPAPQSLQGAAYFTVCLQVRVSEQEAALHKMALDSQAHSAALQGSQEEVRACVRVRALLDPS